MKNDLSNSSLFIKQRYFILFRGLMACGFSLLIAVLAVFNPNVYIMSSESGWLPLLSLLILAYGLLEFFDAIVTIKSKEYLINVQMATLDTVVGLILLIEQFQGHGHLVMLAAAYLIIKGIFRLTAAANVHFPCSGRVIAGSIVSILLGLIVWHQGQNLSAQGLTLALSLDLAIRGWSLVIFARWLLGNENGCTKLQAGSQ